MASIVRLVILFGLGHGSEGYLHSDWNVQRWRSYALESTVTVIFRPYNSDPCVLDVNFGWFGQRRPFSIPINFNVLEISVQSRSMHVSSNYVEC
jgi:hypothetical protein